MDWNKFAEDNKAEIEFIRNRIENFIENYKIIPENPFEIFDRVIPNDVKIVLVGQSPYPADDVACNIAFKKNCPYVPNSLKNIISELRRSYNTRFNLECHANQLLDFWIDQGVLMLNASLTLGKSDKCIIPSYLVEHFVLWENFLVQIFKYLNKLNNKIIFVALGQKAGDLLDNINGVILKFPHPVERNNTFIGCDCFKKINENLQDGIQWIPF